MAFASVMWFVIWHKGSRAGCGVIRLSANLYLGLWPHQRKAGCNEIVWNFTLTVKILHHPGRLQMSVVTCRMGLVIRAALVDSSKWQLGGLRSADRECGGVQRCYICSTYSWPSAVHGKLAALSWGKVTPASGGKKSWTYDFSLAVVPPWESWHYRH